MTFIIYSTYEGSNMTNNTFNTWKSQFHIIKRAFFFSKKKKRKEKQPMNFTTKNDSIETILTLERKLLILFLISWSKGKSENNRYDFRLILHKNISKFNDTSKNWWRVTVHVFSKIIIATATKRNVVINFLWRSFWLTHHQWFYDKSTTFVWCVMKIQVKNCHITNTGLIINYYYFVRVKELKLVYQHYNVTLSAKVTFSFTECFSIAK